MPSNDELMDTRLAAVRQLATLPDGAFNPDGFAWAAAYRQDVTALRARLTTAEQERDRLQHIIDCADTPLMRTVMEQRAAAEARIAALGQTLHEIAEFPEPLLNKNSALNQCDWLKGLARAALACPPQPFDPETSPGMTDLMVSPEAIDEYLAACPPPEEEK